MLHLSVCTNLWPPQENRIYNADVMQDTSAIMYAYDTKYVKAFIC